MEFTEGGKIVGVDPDIAAALSKQLGVEFKFESGTFDTLIGSMQTGRSDLVMSSLTDTKARQEGLDDKGAKTGAGVDFVDYFSASTGILVKKGNPEGIKSLDDLCGKTVAVQRGTTYEDSAKAQAEKCKTDGKGELKIESFPTDAEAQTRVKAGGAAADLNDSPVAAYIAQTAGGGNEFEAIANPTDMRPLRHRGGQEEHRAARRAQGSPRRGHQGRHVQGRPGQVERGLRRRDRGQDQRRFLTSAQTAAH